MKIEVTEDGFWTDAEGNRWRLVPVKATAAQTDAALAKARMWRKDSAARALAWDYLQGYNELVEQAPPPSRPHKGVPKAVAEAEALGPHRNATVLQDNPSAH